MTYLFEVLPQSFILITAFALGVIIGSFLNVYIYRLHTGKSLMGSSHCLSCGRSLRAYELIPLLSYIFLRGRCRTCQSYIPYRYFLVELLTGVLFVLAATFVSDIIILLHILIALSILVVIGVYDLYHTIIPDELTWALIWISLPSWLYKIISGVPYVEYFYTLGAAMLAMLFLMTLWRVSGGRWIGFGDVKFVVPLVLLVGYADAFSLLVLSFWYGAGIGLLILAGQKLYRRGKKHLRFMPAELTMKSAVPFAPFMILGFLTVYFFSVDVVALLSYAP
jgi:leader peptidase (prepilin peptidase) / N-methyltransferase